MVRFTISATPCSLALLLLWQQHTATDGFSNRLATTARATEGGSALFGYAAFQYEENDAIMQEQNGGVVPTKPRTPVQTVPSAMSKITVTKPSDDQHDANFHTVKTVPSAIAMSRIERGSASDDQHDANFHTIRTVPSPVSDTRRPRKSSGLESTSRVTSSTANFCKKSCTYERGEHDPYYE
ncbi:unnamed protein product [Pseudo-nitzschia multistriata]|uniref:Secreted protein n=1 Tax=Pseudo-nitzschia multistriata TaxID=183589 RepID=A0A448ZED3_9STRA|nr:unnamed protein product [Pseudo-nitzschia multistriata]